MPTDASNAVSHPAGSPVLAALRIASQSIAAGRKQQRGLAMALEGLELGESELLVLLAIHDGETAALDHATNSLDQKQLATELGLSPALVSQLVEQMRRQGWIASERNPSDRRRQIWRATPIGRELLARALDQLTAWAANVRHAALALRVPEAASATVSRRGEAA